MVTAVFGNARVEYREEEDMPMKGLALREGLGAVRPQTG